MREVKHSGEWLPEALRDLAASARHQAPPDLGAALKTAYLRRHAGRRRARRMCVAAFAVLVLALSAALGTLRKPATVANNPHPAPVVAARVGTALAVPPAAESSLAASMPPAGASAEIVTESFLPLPAYSPRIADEDLRVVRVELKGESLRLVGAPVHEENADRLLLADFVVGQDGTPYAVRLVLR